MMTLKITSTTDGKYIGHEFVCHGEKCIIHLSDDLDFLPDQIIEIGENQWRLANSNYVLDCEKVGE
jgi:hypothetical protein